jgi:hypothetical protein
MTSRILASILLLSITIISACGGIVPSAQAAPPTQSTTQQATALNGRYLFRAELHTTTGQQFIEGGFLQADGHGVFAIASTFNDSLGLPLTSPNVSIVGSYTMDAHGVGKMTADAADAFRGTEHVYCLSDGSYCSIMSGEPGRSWQGKLWRDTGAGNTTFTTLSGSYLFESEAADNTFAESGIIIPDGSGHYTLQSTFNIAAHPELSYFGDSVEECGQYSFGTQGLGHASQTSCPFNAAAKPDDTFAMYCITDGSRCLLVPDTAEPGTWIAEMRRQ